MDKFWSRVNDWPGFAPLWIFSSSGVLDKCDLPGWMCMWDSHGQDLDFWQPDPQGNWDRMWRLSLPVI